jgi:uncharacterized repeat protein (TIGR01451 family)
MIDRRALVLLSLLFALPPALVGAAPNPPVITEPHIDGQILNPADVHMEASYSDPSGSVHFSTDWELWDTGAQPVEVRAWSRIGVTGPPNLLVHIHLGDGTFEGPYAGHTQLNFDTSYKLRVRFRNADGEDSAWSERPFRTSPQGPPGVPGPMPWVARQAGYTVEVVATGFQLPVNIAFVPNLGSNPTDPFLYVTELYGTIKVVLRDGTMSDYATGVLNYDPNGVFPGSGEQGLAGIVVDPLTGDVFASLLYEDSASLEDRKPHYAKVVRFHSNDGGHTAAGPPTTVLDMFGERFYESHQISNLTIGPDGKLYIHVGDGFDSNFAQDPDSFRGKILRANLNGSAPADNPFYDGGPPFTARDYVFALGMRNPFGGAWRVADGSHYEVENGPSVDRIAKVVAGRNLLWDGTDASMLNFALYNWGLPCPSACPGAHAPVNLAFIQPGTFSGSGFPFAKMDHAYVSESGPTYAAGSQELGKRIVEFAFDMDEHLVSGPTALVEYNGVGRATAVGLAAGPDGLYFTDLYKDEDSDPINPSARGANLLRVRYNAAAEADLAITKTDGHSSSVPGTPVTYTITASNAGPSAATGATVTDMVPASITGVTWTCAGAGGGTCTAAGSGDISDVVNLPVVAAVTYTLTGTISASATGSLSNTATIAAPASVAEIDSSNNSATDTDALTPQADLAITKTDGQGSALPGSPITYAIVAVNAGPSAVGGARVGDVIPTALAGVAWTCMGTGGGTCTASGSGNINDTVNLPVGASVTYTLSGTISPTAGSVSNTATITPPSGVSDPDAANNSATDTDLVSCGDVVAVPDGRLIRATLGDNETARVGATLRIGNSYSLEFKNTDGIAPPGTLTVLSGDDGCSGISTLTTNDTSTIDPSGSGGVARASFVATGTETFFRARLLNDTRGPVTFTFGWSDTTQFSAAWSTNGSFDTFYSFLNTTAAPLTGTLLLLDANGAVLSTLAISIPAGQTAGVNTASLGVARNRTGTAKLTHDGPPGSILAEAAIANFGISPAYVQPVKFQAVRDAR